MLITLAVIVVAAMIGWIDLPDLIHRKEWRETAVYSVMLLTATAFGVIASNLWEFPSPLYIIMWIYDPVNHILARLTGT